MSAVAHTSIDHTNIASVQLNSEPAVTSISVSARIEYIQRFSKQAVLVIDPNVDVYTQAARQYLINLAKEKSHQESNVAFVSASMKLNDIQMRCRLIEQLFANTLFDPEKSLAVSILNLSKQSKDSITIVVEHAHALSLQMKYELCQLVDVANKTHSKINVVLFGLDQAAQETATNRTIFKNKLSIIDAKSGQLFSLEHARFHSENSIFTPKFWQRLVITLLSITALIGLTWFALIKYDNFTLAKLPIFDAAVIEQPSINKEPKITLVPMAAKIVEQANAKDIYAALLGNVILAAETQSQPALAKDILQALALDEVTVPKQIMAEQESQNPTLRVMNEAIAKKSKPEQINNKQTFILPIKLTPNYYLNSSTGYVIQLAGFTDMTVLSDFVKDYPNIEYFSYQRTLNDQPFIVLTSKVFTDKTAANKAMQALPPAIMKRGPWLKSNSAIKREINTVND